MAYNGKRQQQAKKFTREYKVKEIQKSLTKKARLRKQYLKALEEEGYNVPEKSVGSVDAKKLREEKLLDGKKKIDEKKELKNERKRLEREKAVARRREEERKLKETQQKYKEREVRRQKLTQRTRSGQPLMAPRIEDLLNKIKADSTYTG